MEAKLDFRLRLIPWESCMAFAICGAASNIARNRAILLSLVGRWMNISGSGVC